MTTVTARTKKANSLLGMTGEFVSRQSLVFSHGSPVTSRQSQSSVAVFSQFHRRLGMTADWRLRTDE